MPIFEITHINDIQFKRTDRIFFGVGKCKDVDDFETKYVDNISHKNASYCELTGLYCIWKNIETDFVGIEHYRRVFLDKTGRVLSETKIKKILNKKSIILPMYTKLKNDSVFDFYSRNHYISDYYIIREIIRDYYPEYLEKFNEYFHSNKSYLFNMMICNKNLFNDYCTWLFDVLEKAETYINVGLDNRSTYQKRVYGFLAERLLNVWIAKNINPKSIYKLPVSMYPVIKNSFIKKILRYIKYVLVN